MTKCTNRLALHFLAGSTSIKALDAVKKLLDSGKFNVNDKDDEWNLTPLHIASNWGNLSMVQLLIHYGGNPLEKDDEGNTCIDLTDDTNIKKFYKNLMDEKEPKKKFKMMKILKELFGFKKNDEKKFLRKKNWKNLKRKRPNSCFAAFEEMKNIDGKKRRSEKLKSEFRILTDDEVNAMLINFDDGLDKEIVKMPKSSSKITGSMPLMPKNLSAINIRDLPKNVQIPMPNLPRNLQLSINPQILPKPEISTFLPNSSENDLIQRIQKLNLDSKNILKNNEPKNDSNEIVNKKKEKITAVAQTNNGDEFEFYQTISSCASFKVDNSKLLTDEMNTIYPKLPEIDNGFIVGCNDEDILLPPPRTTSLNLNETPKFVKCGIKRNNNVKILPLSLESCESSENSWTPSENLPKLPINVLPTPPTRIQSTRDYVKTPTAPTESDVEEGKNEYKSPLPETPDIPIEIRKLPLTELKRRLKVMGISPGPMLQDNRKYYEKKLVSVEQQKREVYEGKG